jgi:hypothetical protein
MQHYFLTQSSAVVDIDLNNLQHGNTSFHATYKYSNKSTPVPTQINESEREHERKQQQYAYYEGILCNCKYELDDCGLCMCFPVVIGTYYRHDVNSIESVMKICDNTAVPVYDYRVIQYLFDKYCANFNCSNWFGSDELLLKHSFYDYYKINRLYLLIVINEYIRGKKMNYCDLHAIMSHTKNIQEPVGITSRAIFDYFHQIVINLVNDLPILVTDVDSVILDGIIESIVTLYEKYDNIIPDCYVSDCQLLFDVLLSIHTANYIETTYIDFFFNIRD